MNIIHHGCRKKDVHLGGRQIRGVVFVRATQRERMDANKSVAVLCAGAVQRISPKVLYNKFRESNPDAGYTRCSYTTTRIMSDVLMQKACTHVSSEEGDRRMH